MEVDSKEQLKNVQQLRVVRYKYNPEFACLVGLPAEDAVDTGVIAQEVQKIIPDAVKESGDIELPNGNKINNFLVVNKERIFMENVGAVKELCKVTGKLETRIDHLEKITNANRENRERRLSSRASGSTGSSRKAAPPPSDYFCSNRFVQLLIVILVLIMAFCLVAMATLYMLEYHKRSTYDFHHHNPHIYNATLQLPPSDYRHRPPSTFYPHPSSFNNHHNPTKNPKFSFKSHPAVLSKTDPASEPLFHLSKPKVLGKPQYCYPPLPYLDTHCRTFCCAGSALSGAATEYLEIEKRNQVALTTAAGSSPPGGVSSSMPMSQSNNQEDVISNFSSNPLHRNGLDSKRRRRQIEESKEKSRGQRFPPSSSVPGTKSDYIPDTKLITVPSIRILSQNINQSLDASYCMINSHGYHDCVSTDNRYFSSANLTYHVPLSKYWDELVITLIFRFSPRVNISQPQICREYYDQPYCREEDNSITPQQDENTSKEEDQQPNTYSLKLKVGGSPYSRFNIRFSSNLDDLQDLCNMRNNVFEFNFHFYRVCHD